METIKDAQKKKKNEKKKAGARRASVWRLQGWRPEGWGPEGGAPKFRAFFFLSRAHFALLLSLWGLLVEFWWCLKLRDPQMCTLRVLKLSWETPGLAFLVGRAVEERRDEEEVKKERKLEQLMLELRSLLKVPVERRSHHQLSRITALLLVRER